VYCVKLEGNFSISAKFTVIVSNNHPKIRGKMAFTIEENAFLLEYYFHNDMRLYLAVFRSLKEQIFIFIRKCNKTFNVIPIKHRQMPFVSNGGKFKLYTVLNGLIFPTPS
jgi:hypothetical protein